MRCLPYGHRFFLTSAHVSDSKKYKSAVSRQQHFHLVVNGVNSSRGQHTLTNPQKSSDKKGSEMKNRRRLATGRSPTYSLSHFSSGGIGCPPKILSQRVPTQRAMPLRPRLGHGRRERGRGKGREGHRLGGREWREREEKGSSMAAFLRRGHLNQPFSKVQRRHIRLINHTFSNPPIHRMLYKTITKIPPCRVKHRNVYVRERI